MKKALVIVDMQVDFLTGALGNKECAETVGKVLDVLAANEYDAVFATRDTHQEDYMETEEGKNLPVVHCIEGTPGWQLDEKIEAALPAGSTVINKPTFGSVELAKALDGFDEVDLVGVCTGICVLSNALVIKAFHPEIKINVIERATACVTPESRKTALDAMKLCHIHVV